MKFADYEYKRPDLQSMKDSIRALIEQFNEAATVEAQSEIIEKINAYRKDFSTQANLVYIRASIDTTDEYYQQERDALDEMEPEMDEVSYRILSSTSEFTIPRPIRRKMGFTAICISR